MLELTSDSWWVKAAYWYRDVKPPTQTNLCPLFWSAVFGVTIAPIGVALLWPLGFTLMVITEFIYDPIHMKWSNYKYRMQEAKRERDYERWRIEDEIRWGVRPKPAKKPAKFSVLLAYFAAKRDKFCPVVQILPSAKSLGIETVPVGTPDDDTELDRIYNQVEREWADFQQNVAPLQNQLAGPGQILRVPMGGGGLAGLAQPQWVGEPGMFQPVQGLRVNTWIDGIAAQDMRAGEMGVLGADGLVRPLRGAGGDDEG